jgi:hypothetical protein
VLSLAFKQALAWGRTRRVGYGFADVSFAFVNGLGGITEAGVLIASSLRRTGGLILMSCILNRSMRMSPLLSANAWRTLALPPTLDSEGETERKKSK